MTMEAGVAQSVQCLTTDWTTGFRSTTEVNYFASSQSSSEAHPASCLMGTWGHFSGVKRAWGVTLTTYPI
jgi:hypothetical protein